MRVVTCAVQCTAEMSTLCMLGIVLELRVVTARTLQNLRVLLEDRYARVLETSLHRRRSVSPVRSFLRLSR